MDTGGCQSVNIIRSAPTRDYYSEIICILRIIHRLRKYPWISAQTMDPSIAQVDPWISQIHRLRPTLILTLTDSQTSAVINCRPTAGNSLSYDSRHLSKVIVIVLSIAPHSIYGCYPVCFQPDSPHSGGTSSASFPT